MENSTEFCCDITVCYVCKQVLEDPRTLPCFHAFCLKCLLDLESCPLCGDNFLTLVDGLAALPRDPFVEKLVTLKKMFNSNTKKQECKACTEQTSDEVLSVEKYCIDCSQSLCSECVKRHKLVSATADHEILNVKEVFSNLPRLMKSFDDHHCQSHGGKLVDLFCTDCRVELCAKCCGSSHQKHCLQELEECSNEFKTEVINFVKRIESCENIISKRMEQQSLEKLELIQETDSLEKQINAASQETCEIVHRHANKLILETDLQRTVTSNTIEERQRNLHLSLLNLAMFKAYCKEITTNGSSSDVCRSIDPLKARIEDLLQMTKSTMEQSSSSLKLNTYLERLKFEADINILGKLQDKYSGKSSYESKETAVKRLSVQISGLEQALQKETNLNASLRENLSQSTQEEERLTFQLNQEQRERALYECRNADLKEASQKERRDWKRKERNMTEDLSKVNLQLKKAQDKISDLQLQLQNEKTSILDLQNSVEILTKNCEEYEDKEKNILAINQEEKSALIRRNDNLQEDANFLKRLLCDGEFPRKKQPMNYLRDSVFKLQSSIRPVHDGFVSGLAILKNELFIAFRSSSTVEVWNLTSMQFKRRWRLPDVQNPINMVTPLHVHNSVDRCLYILDSQTVSDDFLMTPGTQFKILRVDSEGTLQKSWSVKEKQVKISATDEGNVVLTLKGVNEIREYSKDGNLLLFIQFRWESGIENLQHALKISTDHFIISHGDGKDCLHRICLVDKLGDILKSYGKEWNRRELDCPVYLIKDSAGNVLVVDKLNRRVSVLDSKLKVIKLDATDASSSYDLGSAEKYLFSPEIICLDEYRSIIFALGVGSEGRSKKTFQKLCAFRI